MLLVNYTKHKRAKKGLSANQVSEYLGLSDSTFSKFENGKLTLSKKYIKKLSEILDAPERDLSIMRLADLIVIKHSKEDEFDSAIKLLSEYYGK